MFIYYKYQQMRIQSILILFLSLFAITTAATKLSTELNDSKLPYQQLSTTCDRYVSSLTDHKTLAALRKLELFNLMNLERFELSDSCEFDKTDSENMRNQLLTHLEEQLSKTTYLTKIANLMSFQNILLCGLVCVGFLFIMSFLSDVLFFFGTVLIKILLSRPSIYTIGYVLSFVFLFFKYDDDQNPFKLLFLFDNQSSLFGILCFLATSYYAVRDLCKTIKNNYQKDISYDVRDHCKTIKNNYQTDIHKLPETYYLNIKIIHWTSKIIILTVLTIGSIYHQNWLIGLATVMNLFALIGFGFGSFFGGYYIDFDTRYSTERCVTLAFSLNMLFGFLRIRGYDQHYEFYLAVFETGVIFWATFVGLCGLLVLQNQNNKNLLPYLFSVLVCVFLMYIGNVGDIESYRNLGGTFLVFVALDIQRVVYYELRIRSFTLMLFMIFINIYAIKEMIKVHPEYFILG